MISSASFLRRDLNFSTKEDMKVLGIDTSTSCGSVGLVEDGAVISEYLLDIPLTHTERLLDEIGTVLTRSGCSMEDLTAWAISLGPGSFTGLRIGVSAIKGLAFATRKPVVGVPTLDALAHQIAVTPHPICPLLDARKGEVYTAMYAYGEGHTLQRISEYQALRPAHLLKTIRSQTIFLGSGVRTYRGVLEEYLGPLALFVPEPLNLPRGSIIACLGLERLKHNELLDLSTFAPLYVRPSEAELRWNEPHSGTDRHGEGSCNPR